MAIPAGQFRMGCISGRGCEANELPVLEVEVASFALGRYEVTHAEYERFVAETGRDRPNDDGKCSSPRHPVCGVSWEDATAYANWLSDETGERYRLPQRVGMGVCGTRGDDDAVQLGARHRAQPNKL